MGFGIACNGTAWKIIFRYGSFGVIRLSLVANGLVRFIIIIHYILWLSQDGQAGFSGVRHEPGMEWHGGQGIIYHMCQKKDIKRNCYCLGKGNVKYCLDCAPKFIENAIVSMKNYTQVFKKLKNALEKNKTEHLRHNLANSL